MPQLCATSVRCLLTCSAALRCFLLLALASFSVKQAASAAEIRWLQAIVVEGPILSYWGRIDHVGTQRVRRELESNAVTTLVIRSRGGDVDAGIDLGQLVHEYRLAVVVDVECSSSCANYVFLAGSKRLVRDGAIVLWHGSIEQRDFREEASRLASDPSRSEEADRRLRRLTALREKQVRFFQMIGVDERITRIGQEPVNQGVTWTVPVADMRLFGVSDVDAPDGYGTPDYCRRWLEHRQSAGSSRSQIGCLRVRVTDDGVISAYRAIH
jgi:hypothetical protein